MPLIAKFFRLSLLLFATFAMSACGTTRATTSNLAKPGPNGVVKIGKPYQVGGVWYYPADIKDYDETGVASWYGPQFHGKSTANGEVFDMNTVSAAHPVLPLPSYVEVTNLSNGRQLVVRVNDRGPFAKGRIIDLSRRAAQLLGFDGEGTVPVRVRRVYPDMAVDPAAPRLTEVVTAAPAQTTPPGTVMVDGVPTTGLGASTSVQTAATPAVVQTAALPSTALPQPTVSTAAAGTVFIQVVAVSDPTRANTLAAELKRFGSTLVEQGAQGIYRVRVGPYTSVQAAEMTLAKIRAAGYSDARVLTRPLS